LVAQQQQPKRLTLNNSATGDRRSELIDLTNSDDEESSEREPDVDNDGVDTTDLMEQPNSNSY